MKKRTLIKTFFLCVAALLCLLVFGRPGAVRAEESNSPVYYVNINGEYLSDTGGLYYVQSTDTVTTDSSSDWNARYIPTSGRLILRNYSGGKIICLTNNGKANFEVELIGNNFITETNDIIGLQVNPDNTKTLITSSDYGTLTINVCSMSKECIGIKNFNSGYSSEGVYVQGNANLMILATGKSGIGIKAGGTVGILEQASADIEARYNKDASYSFSAAIYSKGGNLDISTSGSVSVASVARDLQQHNGYGYAFYSGSNSGCLNCSPKSFPYVSLSAVGYHAKLSNRSSVADSTYPNLIKTLKQTGVTEGLLLEYTSGQLPIVGATFPDPSFRSYVRNKYDTNSDGRLSESERLYVKTITVEDDSDSRLYNDAYSLVGIHYFTNLARLTWDPDANDLGAALGNLIELDLRANKELTQVTVRNTRLRELYVSNLNKLTWMDCSKNLLHGPTLSGLTSLTDLQLFDNMITDINVSAIPNLNYLDVGKNLLQTLDVSGSTKLRFLYCDDNNLGSLDLSALTSLEDLHCGGNPFTTLSLTKNTALKWLYADHSQLTTLNVSKNTALTTLDCSSSPSLKTLTLGTNSQLCWVRCFDDDVLNGINISTCSRLRNIVTQGSRRNLTENGISFLEYYTEDGDGYTTGCLDADPGTNLFYSVSGTNYSYQGVNTYFTAFATCGNTGGMQYQWQYRTSSSGSWTDCSSSFEGYRIATLTVPATLSRNGSQYRCKVTNSYNRTAYSPTVTLYVIGIKTHPAAQSAVVGGNVTFAVEAVGGGLTYRWQVSKDSGSTWSNVSDKYEGYNAASLTFAVKATWNNYRYRCVVTDAQGHTLTSSSAKLTVKPKITAQPASASVAVGANASFSVTATGAGLKYRWQVSKDGGSTWKNVSDTYDGYNKATLTFAVKATWNNYRYRCVITDANGKTLTSNTAKLTVAPKITAQPKSVTVSAGAGVSFTVKATGAGLKYRWQVSKDGGSTWNNVADKYDGYNKATLKFTAKATWSGYRYRCVITDANGKTLNSSSAKLTVN